MRQIQNSTSADCYENRRIEVLQIHCKYVVFRRATYDKFLYIFSVAQGVLTSLHSHRGFSPVTASDNRLTVSTVWHAIGISMAGNR